MKYDKTPLFVFMIKPYGYLLIDISKYIKQIVNCFLCCFLFQYNIFTLESYFSFPEFL